jgi:hypothetical protein
MRRYIFPLASSVLCLSLGCSPIEPPTVDASALPDTTDHTGPYEVTARVQARRKIHAVTLVWQNLSEGTVQTQRLEMSPSAENIYRASIPGQGTGARIAFHVEATDDSGDTGADPSPGSSAQCGDNYCFHVLATP